MSELTHVAKSVSWAADAAEEEDRLRAEGRLRAGDIAEEVNIEPSPTSPASRRTSPGGQPLSGELSDLLYDLAIQLQVPPGKWHPAKYVMGLPNFQNLGLRIIDVHASEPFTSLNPPPSYMAFVEHIHASGLFDTAARYADDPANRFVVSRAESQGYTGARPGEYMSLKQKFLVGELPPRGGHRLRTVRSKTSRRPGSAIPRRRATCGSGQQRPRRAPASL